MCDNCFTTEIKKFETKNQWTSFDLELSQKLGQGKLKQIRVINKGQPGDEETLYVYQCVACGQKWKLEEPERGDGHFIKLSTFENLTTRELSNRQLGLIILLLILVFVLVRVIFV